MSSPVWAVRNARREARAKAKFNPASVPEPPELTEQCNAIAAARAAKEAHGSVTCATCGKRRDDTDHLYVASSLKPRCRFVLTETEGTDA